MKSRFLLLLYASCWLWSCRQQDALPQIVNLPAALGSEENPAERLQYERAQLVDPATGMLPPGIQERELRFAQRLAGVNARGTRADTLHWLAAGPDNIGGRTRALATDIRNDQLLLAGGVSGGMWRSLDQGQHWTQCSQPTARQGVTCVVQDPRPGHQDTWYYGTGELAGNTARIHNSLYHGDGIFKSVDNGESWQLLGSTSTGVYQAFDNPFNWLWSLAIDPANGDVYAAIFGAIVRSSDGGSSWTTVLGRDLLAVDLNDQLINTSSRYTQVVISPGRQFYATLSAPLQPDGVASGVFYSADGNAWQEITLPGMSIFYDRMVLAIAPSDEQVAYLLVAAQDQTSFWARVNTTWENRTEYLPGAEGLWESMDTQFSYNMLVKVHPADPDIVYLGGTNLYRSLNGFRSSSQTLLIGGYDPSARSNAYRGHHPDQHELVFLHADPNAMLSANDGGIYLTTDNLAADVSWTPLNNGYITSQFYTIALSKQAQGRRVLGGLQDNGVYARAQDQEDRTWRQLTQGDGAYCATTPDDARNYLSFQQGVTYRVTLNEENAIRAFTRIDPLEGRNYLFINPFVLDPNNYNQMYFAGGDLLWRNHNLGQIPDGGREPTARNWEKIEPSYQEGQTITTLDVSHQPANRVYYGNNLGEVFRLDRAHEKQPSLTRIFAEEGYVSNVTIDPLDANRVMFCYGNYNRYSLYFSADGGETVQKVAGNLEEFPDGSGSGPSLRWIEIIPMSDGSRRYFVGTSVGLFGTSALNDDQTIWTYEGLETLGHAVIRMMDYRPSDGTLVVATHGNGVFEAQVADVLPAFPTNQAASLSILSVFPNPMTDETSLLVRIPEEGQVRVSLLDIQGRQLRVLSDGPQFAGDLKFTWDGSDGNGVAVNSGVYLIRVALGNQVSTAKVLRLGGR